MKTRYLFLLVFLSCSTLLPEQERKYLPQNIILKEVSLSEFVRKRQTIPKGLVFYDKSSITDNSAFVKYYSSIGFPNHSYLVCTFEIFRTKEGGLLLSNIAYMLDYGCDNRGGIVRTDWCLQTEGIIGPTSAEEKEKLMIPCVSEFLLGK
ncbi:hypothetical protein ACQV5M_00225 [Leptospira sp. SA-E8]|uniref:hypothetical protein n=1 Tax=Leptospira sp. SA-E8 TaxID=3422259 RepID=UPI003EC0369D